MKRFTAWLAGFAGGAAVYRAFRRRPPVAPAPDPAEALKAKLAASRAAQVEEPQVDEGVEARRKSVHEQARAAIDEMQGTPDGEAR